MSSHCDSAFIVWNTLISRGYTFGEII